jgi:hypothetical protein
MARRIATGRAGGILTGGILVEKENTLTARENDNVKIEPKGTAIFEVVGNQQLNSQGDLRFADSDSSNWVAFEGPATISSNVTWTLPDADATEANQSLVSDGAGTLSWVTTGAQITDNTVDATVNYPIFGTSTTGTLLNVRTSSSKLTYTPSTGTLESDAMIVNGTIDALREENAYTASHTFVAADQSKVVNMNNSSAATLTVPNDTTYTFPVGAIIYCYRNGSGNVTFAVEAGVTINKVGTMAQYEEFYIRKRAANTWVVIDVPKAASASGGSVGSGGGNIIHTFTGNGNFVVG